MIVIFSKFLRDGQNKNRRYLERDEENMDKVHTIIFRSIHDRILRTKVTSAYGGSQLTWTSLFFLIPISEA